MSRPSSQRVSSIHECLSFPIVSLAIENDLRGFPLIDGLPVEIARTDTIVKILIFADNPNGYPPLQD
jgi:hypothetical protein